MTALPEYWTPEDVVAHFGAAPSAARDIRKLARKLVFPA